LLLSPSLPLSVPQLMSLLGQMELRSFKPTKEVEEKSSETFQFRRSHLKIPLWTEDSIQGETLTFPIWFSEVDLSSHWLFLSHWLILSTSTFFLILSKHLSLKDLPFSDVMVTLRTQKMSTLQPTIPSFQSSLIFRTTLTLDSETLQLSRWVLRSERELRKMLGKLDIWRNWIE